MLCRQKEGVGGRLFPFYLSSELESPAEDKKRRTPINSHYPLLVVIVFAPPSISPARGSRLAHPFAHLIKSPARPAASSTPLSSTLFFLSLFLTVHTKCMLTGYKKNCHREGHWRQTETVPDSEDCYKRTGQRSNETCAVRSSVPQPGTGISGQLCTLLYAKNLCERMDEGRPLP